MYQLFYNFLLEHVFNSISAPWLVANVDKVAGIFALIITITVFILAYSIVLWFVHFITHIFRG